MPTTTTTTTTTNKQQRQQQRQQQQACLFFIRLLDAVIASFRFTVPAAGVRVGLKASRRQHRRVLLETRAAIPISTGGATRQPLPC
jgi:predicted ATPase